MESVPHGLNGIVSILLLFYTEVVKKSKEVFKMNMDQKSLYELRKESQLTQKKGLPFIMASVILWGIIAGIHGSDLTIQDKNMATFCCSCMLMPFVMFFGKLIGAKPFKKSGNPVDKLGMICTFNQILYLVIVMWAYNQKPESMLMLYAIVFGAHLLPFSWIYESRGYMLAALCETVGVLFVRASFGNVGAGIFMAVMEAILCILLMVELTTSFQ